MLCLDYDLLGIDFQFEGMSNRPVGYFNFSDTEEIRATEKDYLKGKLLIDPRLFVTNLRVLKAQVTNIHSNPHQQHQNKK